MKIKIQKIDSDAIIPNYATKGDAGLDFYSVEDIVLKPMERKAIRTGVKIEIPDEYVGLIWDKSGLAGKGLKTAGGVIDSGYRGEIKIVIINLSKNVVSIEKGQKIAQMLIQKIATPTMREVKFLPETKRGQNGFGSTGLM